MQKVKSNEQKVTRNEQTVTSNEHKVTRNEQKVTSNEQKVTSNEQKVTSYEQKLTSNEQKVQPHYSYSATYFITNLANVQLFFTQFKRVSSHCLSYFHFNNTCYICRKPLYLPIFPFIDFQRIALGSTMCIKTYFLNQCNTTKLTNSEEQNENYDCKLYNKA